MSSFNVLRHGNLRRRIASLAARLMAEDGIGNYSQAKRKASRQLGAPNTESLPSNEEIANELRTYQALYQAEEQRQRIRELRTTALSTMALLSEFSPYLAGAVLDGTAGRYAGIDLEIYTDDAKGVEILLLDRGISYRHLAIHRPQLHSPQSILVFEQDETETRLSIYGASERPRQRSTDRHCITRIQAAALENLIAQEDRK